MITLKNLNVSYGKSAAVRDVSFRAEKGSILSVIGPNGSGKSSLLKGILGLVTVSEGSIEFQDEKIESDFGISKIGYMPQVPLFPKNLTVSELIDFFGRLEPFDRDSFAHLFASLGLKSEENKKFGSLSGGTRQKMNILQCFSVKKPVYIVDEPTASLDPYVSHILKEILIAKKNEGSLVLFSTHILSEVEELSDRFLLLSEGALLIDDSPRAFPEKRGCDTLQSSLMDFWNREYGKKK
ncbi:ABC transporter ATP-binding protein [Leptospira fletcheri]|uniref:ABC transporter ATP-binding protein n=1 Tax=Leptospira fletcheri TaxID=2484981 RepID=A0A4R9GF75_9LEPT|nr:ABC transporter ATP-binding protein [Leptospira fletcheri]TGK10191.1 ABC transporter ATP-binding protein [Leptospira fletcheri]